MHIHPVDLRRKERGLLAARTGTDLHDHVLVVVGVLRKQQNLKLPLQPRDILLRTGKLLLCQFLQFLVAFLVQHRKGILDGLPAFFIFAVCLHDRCQIALLLHQLSEAVRVVRHIRLGKLTHDLLIANQQIL